MANSHELLFVNKNGSSSHLSRGNAAELFAIQSHTQSRRRRQAKAQKTNQSKSSRGVPPIDRRTSSSPSLTPDRDLKNSSAQENFVVPSNSLYAETNVKLSSPITGNSSDPFGISVLALDERTYGLLQIPFSDFIIRTFTREALRPARSKNLSKFRHHEAVVRRLRHSIGDPVTMFTTLAYSRSCAAHFSSWFGASPLAEFPPEYYNLQATSSLRAHLENSAQVDSWIILAAYSLGVSEYWIGNLESAMIHMRNIVCLADQLGGLRNLDPYVKESIILGNKHLALFHGVKPLISMDWDPGALSAEKMQKIKSLQNAERRNMARDLLFHPAVNNILKSIAADCADFIRVVHHFADEKDECDFAQEEWLFLRHQSLFYRLMSYDGFSGLNECIRIIMIVWLLQNMESTTHRLHTRHMLDHLLSKLNDGLLQGLTVDQGCTSLLFWIMSTSAMAAEEADIESYYVTATARLAAMIGIETTEVRYQAFLGGYLYSERAQYHALQKLIVEIGRL